MTPQQNDSPNPIAQFGVPAPLAASNTTSSASTDGNNPIADLGVPAKLASEISTTPDFNAHDLVAGPGTALATPESPEWKQEGSGVSDILHGNIGQGASKIWDAERPHVIQGSLLEKAMQKIDPDFHGSVTPEQVQAHNAAYNAGQRPLVDAGQFVDKNQHPITKAIAEATSNLTSPESIATLYASGGLGLVNNPAALGFAKRLMSGGFSAVAIANAYKNYQGFREAVDNKNWPEAEYQITHAVIGGTLGLLAARGAATDTPLADAAMLKNVVTKINPFRKLSPSTEVAGETFATRPIRSGVNQKAGTQAVQNIADQTTSAAGATPTGQATSLRDVFQEPIAAREAVAKTFYKALDDASDNEWTANQNALKNVRNEIRMKSGLNEETDAKLDAAKTRLEWQEEQIIDKAVANGMPPNVADQARTNWYAKSRLEDIQDVFNKKSNISGVRPEMAKPGVKGLPQEQYNFKGIAKDLNAMDPVDLKAALGDDAAQNLVTSVNLAAKQGWASGKAVAAIRAALQLTGLGHIGAASHLIQ